MVYAHIAHEYTSRHLLWILCIMKRCTVYPNIQIEELWWSGAVRECDTSIVSAPLLTWGQHKHRAQAATLQVGEARCHNSGSGPLPAPRPGSSHRVKGLGVMEARAEPCYRNDYWGDPPGGTGQGAETAPDTNTSHYSRNNTPSLPRCHATSVTSPSHWCWMWTI